MIRHHTVGWPYSRLQEHTAGRLMLCCQWDSTPQSQIFHIEWQTGDQNLPTRVGILLIYSIQTDNPTGYQLTWVTSASISIVSTIIFHVRCSSCHKTFNLFCLKQTWTHAGFHNLRLGYLLIGLLISPQCPDIEHMAHKFPNQHCPTDADLTWNNSGPASLTKTNGKSL